MPRRRTLAALGAFVVLLLATNASRAADERVPVGPADFTPVIAPAPDRPRVHVPGFELDRTPVTNEQFLEFVRTHPAWRRDRVASLFADGEYLSHWAAPERLGEGALARQPVTRVSWYAARAYCAAAGGRLPRWYEWELAAAADEKTLDARASPSWRARILDWYAQPGGQALHEVGLGAADVHGVQDLHGLIWEWVEDFNSLMVSGDSRDQGDPDRLAFCGAGASSAQDRENYPVLMRIAFLSSLEARSTGRTLGFRCASLTEPAMSANSPALPVSAPAASVGPRSAAAGASVSSPAPGGVELPSDSLYRLEVPLQDSDGAKSTLGSLRGKPLLVTLFYNNCSSVCPMLTARLQDIERQLPPTLRANITVLMITLDPVRDTPDALRQFKQVHRIEGQEWIVARANSEDVRLLAAALGIRYRELPDHRFNHSTVITLADRDGRVVGRSVGPQAVDAAFLHTVKVIARGRAASRRGGV